MPALVFESVADGQVLSSSPTKNYGSTTTMRVRTGTAAARSYIRFTVSGLTGAPSAARLRLWVTAKGPDGGNVYRVGETWAEATLTWNSAPAIGGTPLGTVGAVSAGTWVEVVLDPSSITGDGSISLGIADGAPNFVDYATRESANRPQLILVPGAAGPASASASPARHPGAMPV